MELQGESTETETSTPARPPRRRMASSVIAPLISIALLVGVWYLCSAQLPAARRFLLPPPHEVVLEGLVDPDARGEILESLWLTTRLAFAGLGIAFVFGMVLGIAMYLFGWLEKASYPILVALQAVPILAISPLMTVAFGYGFGSKVIVCVIISFFPIPTTLLLGMKSVEQGQLDLFRLRGAAWYVRVRKLALPAAIPHLFTALRISAGLSVIGAIVGETFFQQGDPGLGQRLIQYRVLMEYPRLYATLIVSSALGIVTYLVFTAVGNRLTVNWHQAAAK